MSRTPRIAFSQREHRWYIVTRYRIKRGVGLDGLPQKSIIPDFKHDVTDQMTAILDKATHVKRQAKATHRKAPHADR